MESIASISPNEQISNQRDAAAGRLRIFPEKRNPTTIHGGVDRRHRSFSFLTISLKRGLVFSATAIVTLIISSIAVPLTTTVYAQSPTPPPSSPPSQQNTPAPNEQAVPTPPQPNNDVAKPLSYADPAEKLRIDLGGGGLAGGVTVTPNLFLGQPSAAVPLDAPPGRGAASPSIVLQYRLNAGNSWLGADWALDTDRIAIKGDGYEHISSNGKANLVKLVSDVYRQEIESGTFLRYRIMQSEDKSDYWEVTNRDGVRFIYGPTNQSRYGGGAAKEWYLERIVDLEGNYTDFEYDEVDYGLLLKAIRYPGFIGDSTRPTRQPVYSVSFVREHRIRPVPSYIDGRKIECADRLTRVEFYAKKELQYSYELSYEVSQNTGRELLARVQKTGAQGTEMPPTTFEYEGGDVTFSQDSADLRLETRSGLRWSGIPGRMLAFPDLNGDGLPDFCAPENQSVTCWDGTLAKLIGPADRVVYRDPQRVGNLQDAVLYYPDLNSDGRSDLCANSTVGITCWYSDGNKFSDGIDGPNWDFSQRYSTATTRFVNITGDGNLSICHLGAQGIECYKGIGGGFDLDEKHLIRGPAWKADVSENYLTQSRPVGNGFWLDEQYYGTIQWVDLNNDGLADVCAREVSGLTCYLAKKDGGFDLEHPIRSGLFKVGALPAPAPQQIPAQPSPYTKPPPRPPTDWRDPSHYETIQFADINGDGLPDVCARDQDGLVCFLFDGKRFVEETPIRGPNWADPPPVVPPQSAYVYVPPQKKTLKWTDESRYRSIVLADLNGDGRADVCGRTETGYECFVNKNGQFASTAVKGPPISDDWQGGDWNDPNYYRTLRLVDINGDGRPDLCGRSVHGVICALNVGPSQERLVTIKGSLGGKVTLEYLASTAWKQRALPVPATVLHAIQVSDGRNHTYRTEFDYFDGYYKAAEQQFRGFGRVEVKSPASESGARAITDYWFHQGNSLTSGSEDATGPIGFMKGRLYKIEVRNEGDQLLSRQTFEYERSGNGQPYFAPLAKISSYECEQNDCNGAITYQTFVYDVPSGLPSDIDSWDPSDPTLDTHIHRNYKSDLDRWILGQIQSEDHFSGIATKTPVGRTSFYYGVANRCTTNQGIINPFRPSRVERWTNALDSYSTYFGYDQYGNVQCVLDQYGAEHRAAYDEDGLFVIAGVNVATKNRPELISKQSINGLNASTVGYAPFGTLAEILDANGVAVKQTFDDLGRIRSSATGERLVSIDFHNLGDPSAQYVLRRDSMKLERKVYFDGLGRTYKVVETGPEQTEIAMDTEFDANGAISSVSLPHRVGEPSLGFTKRRYDALGRLTAESNPDGNSVAQCYGIRTQAMVTSDGRRTLAQLNAFHETTAFYEYSGTADHCLTVLGTPSTVSRFDYDNQGRLKKARQLDKLDATASVLQSVEFDYDWIGRKTAIRDSTTGSVSVSYDDVHHFVVETRPNNVSIHLQFDLYGRPKKKWVTGSRNAADSAPIEYGYDEAKGSIGELSRVTRGSETSQFLYSQDGKSAEVRRLIDGQQFVTKSKYDLNGRLTELTYPDGYTLRYVYDGPALSNILRPNGSSVVRFSSFLTGFGATRIDYGDKTASVLDFSNNASGKCGGAHGSICSISHIDSNGKVVWLEKYSYDDYGRLTSRELNGRLEEYKYDDFGRLKSVAGNESRAFSYDDLDTIRDSSSPAELRKPQSMPTFLSKLGTRTFAPDARGNIKAIFDVGRQSQQLEYDANRRITSFKTSGGEQVTYRYDGLGSLVSRTRTFDSTLFAGRNYWCSNKKCFRSIGYGSNAIAIDESGSSPNAQYLHADRLGSTVLITSSTGGRRSSIQYDVLGEPSGGPEVTSSVIPSSFLGRPRDPVANIDFLGKRVFDSKSGRFLQPDDGLVALPSFRASNRYSYAFNDPLSYKDPQGDFGFLAVVAIAAAIGAIEGVAENQRNGGNWLNSVLGGAARGAIFGAVGYGVGAGVSALGGAPFMAAVAGGAVSGGLAAETAHAGSFGEGAQRGALFSAVSYAAGDAMLPDTPAETPSAAVASEVGRDVLRDAIAGTVVAAVYQEDLGQGALQGAQRGAIGFVVNNAVGYCIGKAYSHGGDAQFRKGTWYFRAEKNIDDSSAGVTVGMFSTINPRPFDIAFNKVEVGSNEIRVTERLINHEATHTAQASVLGLNYLPAYFSAAAASGSFSNNAYESGWGVTSDETMSPGSRSTLFGPPLYH